MQPNESAGQLNHSANLTFLQTCLFLIAIMEYCHCESKWIGDVEYTEYNQFIGSVFRKCTYAPLDYLPIILGWLSCIAWVIALMPQFWKNYKRKECESISTAFMMAWLFGDIGSVIGNILLDGPVTLSILFAYFCSTDVVMLSQMYYYSRVYKGRDLPTAAGNPSATKTPLYAVLLLATGALAFSQVPQSSNIDSSVGRSLLSIELCNDSQPVSTAVYTIASIISWIAGALYFFSRVPQVLQNFRTKSCEGLSLSTFLLAIFANICTGLVFISENVIRSHRGEPMDWADFCAAELPFVIGSLGTLVYDFIIVYQTVFYRKR